MSAEAKGDTLVVNGDIFIQVFSFKDANLIPWGACAVNTVAECSGHYRTSLTAEACIVEGPCVIILRFRNVFFRNTCTQERRE